MVQFSNSVLVEFVNDGLVGEAVLDHLVDGFTGSVGEAGHFAAARARTPAQESATVQVARYAAELGGDAPEVRALLDDSLRRSGVDPARVTLDVVPARVGWREPLTVTVRTTATLAIPFLLTAAIPLRTTAIVRGELAR